MVETMSGYDDYKNDLQGYNDLVNRAKVGMKWWCFVNKDGRYVDIGFCNSESECFDLGYREGGGRKFECIPIATTNVAEAHRRFKHILLTRSHNLDQATSLISRKPAEQKKKEEVKRDKPFGEGLF